MTSREAAPSDPRRPWPGIPVSQHREQSGILGANDRQLADVRDIETRDVALELERCESVLLSNQADGNLDTVLVAVLHLVIQHHLRRAESAVACCFLNPVSPTASILRPSHVELKDDQFIGDVLSQIATQLATERPVQIDLAADGWSDRLAPGFVFLGVASVPNAGSPMLSPLQVQPPRDSVMLASSVPRGAELAALRVSSPFTALMSVSDFVQCFAAALSALATPSGKVVAVRSQLESLCTEDNSRLQVMIPQVTKLWADVLDVPACDLDARSSYFAVGGSSLNAFRLVNRVRRDFGRDISIRDVLDNPTVAEFARLLASD